MRKSQSPLLALFLVLTCSLTSHAQWDLLPALLGQFDDSANANFFDHLGDLDTNLSVNHVQTNLKIN